MALTSVLYCNLLNIVYSPYYGSPPQIESLSVTSQKDEFVKLWEKKEIMGCEKIFGKSIIKTVHSPKLSSLLEFVAEIWALLSPIMSIQNLLILHWVLTEGPKAKLEGFVWR